MRRRTLLKAGVATAAGGLLPVSEALIASASAAPRARTLARNLSIPWGIDFLPNGSALVGERNSGRVVLVRKDGSHRPVGLVSEAYNDGTGEGGLLGLALSPGFAQNRWLYAFVTTTSDNRVVRMKYENGRIGARQVILGGIPSASNHNGGGLWFSSSSLFVSTGDATNEAAAQRKNSLAGKILRLTPGGAAQAGNPFGNRVYSYGHRNPEGITISPAGTIWSSEFGQNTWDELNQIVKGGNYGWPRVEGKDGAGGFRDPLAQWNPANCSPSGIAVLGGRAWLGALRGQSLWSVDLAGAHRGAKRRHFQGRYGRIRLVKRAPDGSLWIGTSNRDGRNPDGPAPNDDRLIRVTV